MLNKKIEKIIQKADALYKEQTKVVEPKKEKAKKPEVVPTDAERFSVWWHMHNFWWKYDNYKFKNISSYSMHGYSGIIFSVIFLSLTLFLFYAYDVLFPIIINSSRNSLITIGAICFCFLYEMIRYFQFKSWRKKLGFILVGWEDLVNTTNLHNWMWRNCNVKVEIKPSTPDEVQNAISSSLKLFQDKSNKWYYDLELGESEKRTHWSVFKLYASGSVNLDVIREIRNLIVNEFYQIHKYYSCIEKVIINVSDNQIYQDESMPRGGE